MIDNSMVPALAQIGSAEMASENPTVAAMKALTKNQKIAFQDTAAHLHELAHGDDRLMAIVCAALLESCLDAMYERVFKSGISSGLRSEVFSSDGPLSSFSKKITLAEALGHIDRSTARDAHHIRNIRNTFAHALQPISFKTNEIAAVCKLLKLKRFQNNASAPTTDPKKIFLYRSLQLSQMVVLGIPDDESGLSDH